MSDLDPRAPFIHDPSSFPLLTGARARRAFLDERGAATAEYAIATMATVARLNVPLTRALAPRFGSSISASVGPP